MTLHVLGLGDNVVDQYLHSHLMYPGGNALNFAVYAKKLGADASFMGVFGSDQAAEHMKNVLAEIGVKTPRCRTVEGENGSCCINLVEGERVFVRSNKGGVLREHPLVLLPEDIGYIKQFDLVHSSLNSYIEPELYKIREAGIPISFDFSVRGTDDYFRMVCPQVTYGFISCGALSDAETDEKMEKLLAFGCAQVIATRGEKGSIYRDHAECFVYRPHYVEPVDTLGAGDSFLTGFLLTVLQARKEKGDAATGCAKEELILTAMRKGSDFAAKTVLVNGAFGYGMNFSEK